MIDEAPEADAFFPEIDGDVWRTVKEEFHPADERHTQSFSFVDMVRR